MSRVILSNISGLFREGILNKIPGRILLEMLTVKLLQTKAKSNQSGRTPMLEQKLKFESHPHPLGLRPQFSSPGPPYHFHYFHFAFIN